MPLTPWADTNDAMNNLDAHGGMGAAQIARPEKVDAGAGSQSKRAGRVAVGGNHGSVAG